MTPVPRLILITTLIVASAAPVHAADEVVVPDVEGQTAEKAVDLLEAAGCAARVIDVAGPEVDVVDNQRPEAGARVARGTSVSIRVGIRARIETELPDVTGRPLEDAIELLAGAYDVHVTPRESDTSPAGTVVATSPTPGTTLYYRASLVVYVASPKAGATAEDAPTPDEETVPCGVGETPDDARKLLEDAGYAVEVVSRWAADAMPGLVIAQDPPAARPAKKGAAVTLFVPKRATVPSVVGLTQMDAVRALAVAGFATRFDPRPAGRLDARVVAQRPEEGGQSVVGSPVVLRFDDDKKGGGRIWNAPAPRFVVVPDVVGRSPGDAEAALREVGLSSTVEAEGAKTSGTVVTAMSHAPRARLRKGATVTLVAGALAGIRARPRGASPFGDASGIKKERPKAPGK